MATNILSLTYRRLNC